VDSCALFSLGWQWAARRQHFFRPKRPGQSRAPTGKKNGERATGEERPREERSQEAAHWQPSLGLSTGGGASLSPVELGKFAPGQPLEVGALRPIGAPLHSGHQPAPGRQRGARRWRAAIIIIVIIIIIIKN